MSIHRQFESFCYFVMGNLLWVSGWVDQVVVWKTIVSQVSHLIYQSITLLDIQLWIAMDGVTYSTNFRALVIQEVIHTAISDWESDWTASLLITGSSYLMYTWNVLHRWSLGMRYGIFIFKGRQVSKALFIDYSIKNTCEFYKKNTRRILQEKYQLGSLIPFHIWLVSLSWAVVTPVKYKCDIQWVTSILKNGKNLKNKRMEDISLVTPT